MRQGIEFGTLSALACVLFLSACASKEPRSAEDAMAESPARARSSAATCYDSFGQPVPEEQVVASRRYGRPYCGDYYVVQQRRRGESTPSAGRGTVMEPGSINLPSSPVPLPGGMGVLR